MKEKMNLNEMVDYYFADKPIGTIQTSDGIKPFTKDDLFLLFEEVAAEIDSGE